MIAYPADHVRPGGRSLKNIAQSFTPSMGSNAVNQGYQGNYFGTGIYAHLGNPGCEMGNANNRCSGAKARRRLTFSVLSSMACSQSPATSCHVAT